MVIALIFVTLFAIWWWYWMSHTKKREERKRHRWGNGHFTPEQFAVLDDLVTRTTPVKISKEYMDWAIKERNDRQS